jgi:hypothetical protein
MRPVATLSLELLSQATHAGHREAAGRAWMASFLHRGLVIDMKAA